MQLVWLGQLGALGLQAGNASLALQSERHCVPVIAKDASMMTQHLPLEHVASVLHASVT